MLEICRTKKVAPYWHSHSLESFVIGEHASVIYKELHDWLTIYLSEQFESTGSF
jgi:hypothetical protein